MTDQSILDEIKTLKEQSFTTKRVVSPALEEILYDILPVLDHGFIRVIDYMGDDASVVQAARVSYGKGTKKISEDAGLINYLMRHRHTTPFEMCEIKFHIKLPIFIARQWIRHRTANVNEYSARYSILDKEFYIPTVENMAGQLSSNRQGRGDALPVEQAQELMRILREDSERVYAHYQASLNLNEQGEILDPEKSGLARELARMNLSLNYYTQWYWKIDLQNLMHFLSLRADSHAQYEIRSYAEIMLDILAKWLPLTHAAFMNYRIGGMSLSSKGVDIVKRLMKGEQVTQETSGLSAGEWREMMKNFM